MAREAPALPLLVVGTYRDVELDRRHPLAEVLPALRRTHGVVLELGGELSSAAICARELEIPAVFAVPEAMNEIRSGAWLSVHGDLGTVSVSATCLLSIS